MLSQEALEDRSYRLYQFNWMDEMGFSVDFMLDHLQEISKSFDETFKDEQTTYSDAISSIIDQFYDSDGFGGSQIFVCKEEFLDHEYLDHDYMENLFSHASSPKDIEDLVNAYNHYVNQ